MRQAMAFIIIKVYNLNHNSRFQTYFGFYINYSLDDFFKTS